MTGSKYRVLFFPVLLLLFMIACGNPGGSGGRDAQTPDRSGQAAAGSRQTADRNRKTDGRNRKTADRNRQTDDRKGKIAVRDILGREVFIPSHIDRVIGLRAGALRLLVYMDLTDRIAGVEQNEKQGTTPYMTAYPELAALPSLGPSMGGDAELILKSDPDVIFITYTTAGDADALQQKTGIPVVALECPEFGTARDTLFASLILIGRIMNRSGRADTLINYINSSLAEMDGRTSGTADTEKPAVYIGGVGYSGSYGIKSTQPFYPPFMFVNARNPASEIDKRLISHVKGTHIDTEQLILWDPDILFIDEAGLALAKQDLRRGTALNNSLKAIKENRIYTLLPYNNYATNYEMVLANAWFTGKILYPEKFRDIDIEEKTGEVYRAFLGRDISRETANSSVAFRTINKNEL